MGEKVCQFKGFMQQDAQEFMAFLLDGLHEVKVVNNFFSGTSSRCSRKKPFMLCQSNQYKDFDESLSTVSKILHCKPVCCR